MTVPTRKPDSDQNSDERGQGETSTTYQFGCEYCDEVLRNESIEGMYDRGTVHLEDHREDLLELFAENPQPKHCGNDCGYFFSASADSVDGFECPECEHDNFDSFARQHLYWGMELMSN